MAEEERRLQEPKLSDGIRALVMEAGDRGSRLSAKQKPNAHVS